MFETTFWNPASAGLFVTLVHTAPVRFEQLCSPYWNAHAGHAATIFVPVGVNDSGGTTVIALVTTAVTPNPLWMVIAIG